MSDRDAGIDQEIEHRTDRAVCSTIPSASPFVIREPFLHNLVSLK
jgi:hypothetical protein